MNRLVLIGNGFDLAHGMKTRYHDFFLHYLKSCFNQASHDNYSDELLEIVRYRHIRSPDLNSITSLKDLMVFESGTNFNKAFISYFVGNNRAQQEEEQRPFVLKIKNDFVKRLGTACCEYNWVDIENEYYETLKKLLDENEPRKKKKVDELNKALHYIIQLFANYLKGIKPAKLIPQYDSIFKEQIEASEIVTHSLHGNEYPKKSLILNFNYTNTIEEYFLKKITPIPINYIHGQLDNESNPIIFGFGDEIDDDYPRLEKEKTKGFLEYVKSFGYFKTKNYQNLIRFIDEDVFQVFVLGHSCGLSDRTMLNMIFEHTNCKSIKVFYHQSKVGNNFKELTEEISRHFHSKGEMRKKLVPFTQSYAMPQCS